jgi:hypothetical protein
LGKERKMQRTAMAEEAWWLHRERRLRLESLKLELTSGEAEEVLVHAVGTIQGRITGMDPGERGIEFQFQLDGKKFRILDAEVFDIEYLPTGSSVVHLTGKLEPVED